MPLLEGGCAWGGFCCAERPWFLHGLPHPQPLLSVLCVSLLCLGRLFWEVLGFRFLLVSPARSLWGWNTVPCQGSPAGPRSDRAVGVTHVGTKKSVLCPKPSCGAAVGAASPISSPFEREASSLGRVCVRRRGGKAWFGRKEGGGSGEEGEAPPAQTHAPGLQPVMSSLGIIRGFA